MSSEDHMAGRARADEERGRLLALVEEVTADRGTHSVELELRRLHRQAARVPGLTRLVAEQQVELERLRADRDEARALARYLVRSPEQDQQGTEGRMQTGHPGWLHEP